MNCQTFLHSVDVVNFIQYVNYCRSHRYNDCDRYYRILLFAERWKPPALNSNYPCTDSSYPNGTFSLYFCVLFVYLKFGGVGMVVTNRRTSSKILPQFHFCRAGWGQIIGWYHSQQMVVLSHQLFLKSVTRHGLMNYCCRSGISCRMTRTELDK